MVAGRVGISVVGKRTTRLSGDIFTDTPTLPSSRSFPGKRRYAYCTLTEEAASFSNLADRWFCSVQASVKASTAAHYRYTLDRYILPVLGSFSVRQLTETKVEVALQEIVSVSQKRHKPLGYTTARECLTLVRRICRYGCHLHVMPPLYIEFQLSNQPMRQEPVINAKGDALSKTMLYATPPLERWGFFYVGIRAAYR